VPCAKCGHSLRGLAPTIPCPRCGHAITASRLTFKQSQWSVSWLRSVRAGAWWIEVALVIHIAIAGLLVLVGQVGETSVRVSLVFGVLQLLVAAAMGYGSSR